LDQASDEEGSVDRGGSDNGSVVADRVDDLDDINVVWEPLEEQPEREECNDDCDCDAIDANDYGGDDLLKYMEWGQLEITETGAEVLRFLSMVMKGNSMSVNKADDLLRYKTCCLCVICLLCFVFTNR
jgi:hypothetical protein